MNDGSSASKPSEDPRRRKLMDAALGIFVRFGFRKTSMDEVARAAGVSRQGLYLHFATKEELFRATVQHALDSAMEAAAASLGDASLPLESRLIGAFDAWVGPYIGMVGPGASDLAEASSELAGPLVAQHEARFVEAVTKAIRGSGLVAVYKPAGLTAQKLADTLYATARGLKHSSATRAAFVEGIGVAVRVMCMPLEED